MMTPRQRVMAVLRGERPDKIPFTAYENKLMPSATERRLRNEGLCIVHRRARAYKMTTPDCRLEEHIVQTGNIVESRSTWHTPAGPLSETLERTGNASRRTEYLFKGPEDYAALLALIRGRRYQPTYEAFESAQRQMGEDVFLRCDIGTSPLVTLMVHTMDVMTFGEEWLERRERVLEVMDALKENLRTIWKILADSPITLTNIGGNEIPEMVGPPRFKEHTIPLYNECAEALHAKGKLLGSHLDGNNRAWADALAACKLDLVEAFSPAPDTDMTLEEALNAWPDKILWINFPSSVHLEGVAKVRKTAEEYVALARRTNRVIIGITEDYPQENWQENFLAISDAVNRG